MKTLKEFEQDLLEVYTKKFVKKLIDDPSVDSKEQDEIISTVIVGKHDSVNGDIEVKLSKKGSFEQFNVEGKISGKSIKKSKISLKEVLKLIDQIES
tara:strand:- start:867 stop:1157 length:291 start_codon:yes stop_codon:yes gene_type:complete